LVLIQGFSRSYTKVRNIRLDDAHFILPTTHSWLHCVGASGFEYIDGQKAEWVLRITIAKQGVRNIGPILQGLASSILSWIIAAISGLGNALDDVDRSRNGMPVKRGYATGWIGYLSQDKFPVIARQWKTFENLTCDTRKPGLLGADGPIDAFTHGIPFSYRALNRSEQGGFATCPP